MITKKEYESLKKQIVHHSHLYYDLDSPELTAYEFDAMMHQIKEAEEENPEWVTPDSPTKHVGGNTGKSTFEKVEHTVPMLSLQDVFSEKEVCSFIAGIPGESSLRIPEYVVEEKIDGLSVSATYRKGKESAISLVRAETRGDGYVGEDITENARHIIGIPAKIPFTGKMVVRGESLMKYEDFKRVNSQSEDGSQYKNPRNLCVGTVRNLDSKVTAERNINFFAFNLVSAECYENDSFAERIEWLKSLGFQPVYCIK